MSSRRRAAIAAAMLAAACTGPGTAPAPASASAAPTAEPVSGTYEIVLCQGCDADAAPPAQRIRVSLYAEPLFISGPLAGAYPPHDLRILRRRVTLERENYCFSIPPAYTHGLVGAVYDTAIAVWTRTPGDSIRFPLYLSPDAGVEVRVRIDGGRMSGVLEDYYAPDRPVQVIGGVAGRRVGPPDPAVCGLRERVHPGAAAAPE